MAKAKRTFNPQTALADARAGLLVGSELRKTIKIADDFGNKAVAEELKLYLIQSASFAGDSAPEEIRDRVAKGVSALTAMGEPLSRTKQMLRKHGVIETISRIANYPNATKNFDKLCGAGLSYFTAEAIVLDYPHLFSNATAVVARRRLGR